MTVAAGGIAEGSSTLDVHRQPHGAERRPQEHQRPAPDQGSGTAAVVGSPAAAHSVAPPGYQLTAV